MRKKQQDIHCETLQLLFQEFKRPIINEKRVFLLSTVRERFQEMLQMADYDDPGAYTSKKLKQKLAKEWSGICFVPQRGVSDLVCSSDINVGDALMKANQLQKKMKDSEICDDLNNNEPEMPEDAIVHRAIGILRRRIEVIKDLNDQYYSSDEMTIESLQKFIDSLLYDAI